MSCEVETVPVTYRVDCEIAGVSGSQPFGEVRTYAEAEHLLLILAGRSNVNKATIVKIVGV